VEFWEVTPAEWALQVRGYQRRRLHTMQDLAQHFIWVKSLVTSKGAKRADQLVRDPDERKIYSSDFVEPGGFRRELDRLTSEGG